MVLRLTVICKVNFYFMLADILEHRFFFAVYIELKTNFECKSAKEAITALIYRVTFDFLFALEDICR